MNWNNLCKGGWSIDHIVPLILAENMNELSLLLSYKNLQPLMGTDNQKKGSLYKGVRVYYWNRHLFRYDISKIKLMKTEEIKEFSKNKNI